MTDRNLLADLRRAPLFSELDDAQLDALSPAVHTQDLAVGEVLFTQGQSADRFFLVRSGQMKLARVSPDGDEKIIEIIQPGQTFAEAVMFMGMKGRYPVNAQALSETRLFAIEQKSFLDMLRASPELCFKLMGALSLRLHALVNQIEALTLQNATYRLVMYLLDQVPQDVQHSPQITLTTPKGAIASRLAIQPETFSRLLARLRDSGLVEVRGHHIVLRDLKALRAMVDLPA